MKKFFEKVLITILKILLCLIIAFILGYVVYTGVVA